MLPRVLIVLCVAVGGFGLARAAHAEGAVRRCSDASGRAIYTDKPCPQPVATTPTPLPTSASPVSPGGKAVIASPIQRFSSRLRPGCARTADALLDQVSMAVSTGDPNQLVNAYHWAGMSSDEGYRVLGRLQALLGRPIMHVSLVYPEVEVTPQDYTLTDSGWPINASSTANSANLAPVGLRIDQQARGSAQTHTLLRLRRHFECWWITF